MFGIWKRKKTEVMEHKYVPLHNFQMSVDEFYRSIEAELELRALTGLEFSRITYSEGGMFAARREYLRVRRERLVFDVCAAPFGNEWFFSWRVAVIPMHIALWEVAVLLIMLGTLYLFYADLFGWTLGPIFLGASLLSVLLLMRTTISLGMHDVDAALMQIPVIGAIYERFLRKEDTYYREDTRLAYQTFVTSVIKEKIDEATAANGIQMVEYLDAVPPFHPRILKMMSDLMRGNRGLT
jgi:hypothetical protein